MSFLARLAMRAGIPGGGAEPLMVPKDRGLQRSPRLSRQEASPEEQIQTLRRQIETEGQEEEAQTLRRKVRENEGAAPAPVVAPTSEEDGPEFRPAGTSAAAVPGREPVPPVRRLARMAKEGDAQQTVRRMAGAPEEEEEQPVRRMKEDEENAQPPSLRRSGVIRRSVRGAPARGPAEFGSGDPPAPEIVAHGPEPSNPRAPDMTPPMPSPAWPGVPVPIADRPDRSSWSADAPIAALRPQPLTEAPAGAPRDRFERPQVVIDRLDVLIHEPTPPARGPDSAKRRSRSFRARYLKRL